MLSKLLIRELILNKKLLLTYALMITLLFGLYPVVIDHAKTMVAFSYIYLAFVPASLFAREQKLRSAAITCSLPVTRNEVLLSKYLLSLGLVLIGMLYLIIVVWVSPFVSFLKAEMLDYRNLAPGIFTVSLAMAILLPFIIGLGFMGLIVLLVGLQLVAAALLLAARAFSGTFRDGIGAIIEGVGSMFAFLKDSLGQPKYALFLIGIGVLLIVLSYFVSLALYKRKEL